MAADPVEKAGELMASTGIEYGQVAWNPVTGCTPISEGCEHCWAQRMSKRLAGRNGYPKNDPFQVTIHPDRLNDLYRLQKPRIILVNFMGDLFHESVSFRYLALVFGAMHTVNQHTYLVLTKRPMRMAAFFHWFTGPDWRGAWPQEYPHVWIGVTAENQARADERIPVLLAIPAAKRFVSIEPMLGPVVLRKKAANEQEIIQAAMMGLMDDYSRPIERGIDWVICGGESGPGARPMNPNWVRSLRDQCVEAGTSFYFKQWGDWGEESFHQSVVHTKPFGCWYRGRFLNGVSQNEEVYPGTINMVKLGKKHTGKLLEGKEWQQMPNG